MFASWRVSVYVCVCVWPSVPDWSPVPCTALGRVTGTLRWGNSEHNVLPDLRSERADVTLPFLIPLGD